MENAFVCTISEHTQINTRHGKRIYCDRERCGHSSCSWIAIVNHYEAEHDISQEAMQHHYIFKEAMHELIAKKGYDLTPFEYALAEPVSDDPYVFRCKVCDVFRSKRGAAAHYRSDPHFLDPEQISDLIVVQDASGTQRQKPLRCVYSACYHRYEVENGLHEPDPVENHHDALVGGHGDNVGLGATPKASAPSPPLSTSGASAIVALGAEPNAMVLLELPRAGPSEFSEVPSQTTMALEGCGLVVEAGSSASTDQRKYKWVDMLPIEVRQHALLSTMPHGPYRSRMEQAFEHCNSRPERSTVRTSWSRQLAPLPTHQGELVIRLRSFVWNHSMYDVKSKRHSWPISGGFIPDLSAFGEYLLARVKQESRRRTLQCAVRNFFTMIEPHGAYNHIDGMVYMFKHNILSRIFQEQVTDAKYPWTKLMTCALKQFNEHLQIECIKHDPPLIEAEKRIRVANDEVIEPVAARAAWAGHERSIHKENEDTARLEVMPTFDEFKGAVKEALVDMVALAKALREKLDLGFNMHHAATINMNGILFCGAPVGRPGEIARLELRYALEVIAKVQDHFVCQYHKTSAIHGESCKYLPPSTFQASEIYAKLAGRRLDGPFLMPCNAGTQKICVSTYLSRFIEMHLPSHDISAVTPTMIRKMWTTEVHDDPHGETSEKILASLQAHQSREAKKTYRLRKAAIDARRAKALIDGVMGGPVEWPTAEELSDEVLTASLKRMADFFSRRGADDDVLEADAGSEEGEEEEQSVCDEEVDPDAVNDEDEEGCEPAAKRGRSQKLSDQQREWIVAWRNQFWGSVLLKAPNAAGVRQCITEGVGAGMFETEEEDSKAFFERVRHVMAKHNFP